MLVIKDIIHIYYMVFAVVCGMDSIYKGMGICCVAVSSNSQWSNVYGNVYDNNSWVENRFMINVYIIPLSWTLCGAR